MKLIFTTDTLDRGGKERQLTLLFSALPAGIDRQIWTKNYNPEAGYLQEYATDLNAIKTYKGFWDFYRLVKHEKPDLIFSWDVKSVVYALILRLFFRFRFWNGSIRHGIRSRKFSHFLRSAAAWISPVVIANSYAGLKANNLKPSGNHLVIYNGIDPKFSYQGVKEHKRESLKKLFPDYDPGKDLVFISVANFTPYKDYFSVLEVLNELKHTLPFKYIIIGSGPLRKEIEASINTFQLQDHILLTGSTKNVADYLQLADMMVHSSKGEGLSNAILEAMYAGLPIIASNVGGVPETVFPEYSALFEYRDKSQLKKSLLSARKLITKFNYHNQEYQAHLNKFSVQKMMTTFNTILKNKLSWEFTEQ